MSLVLQLLARYWYVPVAMAIAGTGVYTLDSTSYARLQTSFASYKAQVAQDQSAAQKAAREALQVQIDARQAAEDRNAIILQKLNDTQTRADAAARDAEFAKRLLAAARAAGTPGAQVPEAGDRSPIASARGTPSGKEVEGTLTSAIGECERNADRLDALIAELKPQL